MMFSPAERTSAIPLPSTPRETTAASQVDPACANRHGRIEPETPLTVERYGDLGLIRSEWEELAVQSGNVFATWEWADAWRRHLGAGFDLSIALIRRADGTPQALLPLYVARAWPLHVLRFVGAGPSDELGPLCAPADRPLAAKMLRHHWSEALGDGGMFLAECLWGDNGIASALGGVTLQRRSSPRLSLAGRNFDDYLAARSRNFRSQVRRYERQLEREHRLQYRLTQDPDELERDMATMMRLHRARWNDQPTRAFAGAREAFHHDFARRALERGWLRLWTMYLDGEPAAAWYGLRYAGVETYYQAGRDPRPAARHVGFVLLCHTLRCAFEDGMSEYRFGMGDEPYKYRFTDDDPGLETVALASGRRGRLGLAALRAALGVRQAVRRRGRP